METLVIALTVGGQIFTIAAIIALMWQGFAHKPDTEFAYAGFWARFLVCVLVLGFLLFEDGMEYHRRELYEVRMEEIDLAHFLTTNECDGEDLLEEVDNGYRCGSQICVYLKEGSGFCGPVR